MKKNIADIQRQREPIVCLTAYTAPIAATAQQHCDLLLVGDSVSMVLYGAATTQEADMAMMIRHGQAVVKAAPHALVIVDLPYGSYESDPVIALKNAQKIMDKTGCDGIKLEGGSVRAETIRYLTNNDIPVMGHIGLLPQSVSSPEGYRVQGKDETAAAILKEDASAVEDAGAFAVVVEAVPEPLAADITDMIGIPTIGIGASNACNGQILVSEDMLGLSLGKPPKFVKQYAALQDSIEKAIENYAKEVKTRAFPAQENTYKAAKQAPLKKAS